MVSFLNDKYQKIGIQKFVTLTSILCFISDVANIAYLNLYALQKYISDKAIATALFAQGVTPGSITSHDLYAYKKLMINSIGMVMGCFLIYHIFVYFMLARNKQWARKYVYGYALTGSLLTFFELYFLMREHFFWGIVMLVTTIIYIYTLMGLRYFRKLEL